MTKEKWVVYLVRCSDNSLYCGISNDFERRLEKHNTGKGAKYTKSRKPVELVGKSPEIAKNEALKLEYRIKRTVAGKKIAELEKTGRQILIERDLESLAKEIRALGKKVERIAKVIERSGTYKR
jgi:putative endonuclease